MYTEDQIIEKLKGMVSERRFHHSLRVKDTAMELAKVYGIDVEKAKLAAILHDCAKGYNCEQLLALCDEFNIELDEVTKFNKQLIHAPLGAKVAQIEFGIEDADILNAIHFHTTGRENMSMLEKIICTSDYVEPKRSFDGVDEIRELAYIDIDRALFIAFGITINYIISNNYILHPTTVMARNDLLKKII